MCDYPDYIELYKRHPKFSTQYLKNINAVIKLTNTKEEFYEYITDNQYGIYKLLYILSKIDTVSTKKSYVCAVKHLMVQVIPNSEANCKVLETEIADLIFRNNRITRNKKNSEIKSNSIEHHRFLIQQLKTEFFCIYGTLEKNTYNKKSELASIFWILSTLGPVRPSVKILVYLNQLVQTVQEFVIFLCRFLV